MKFFLLAVFATMYVRDHARVEFHKALGVDPTDYDFEVFRITSEISRQVFPLTLDLENPAFHAALDRLLRSPRRWRRRASRAASSASSSGGPGSPPRQWASLRLYLIPAKRNDLPQQVRLAPAW